MPRQFCCKHCGMITDNPTIVPHPDKDAYFRNLEKHHSSYLKKVECPISHYTIIVYDLLFVELQGRYNHSITCPVCLNETRFWREKPFPTDVPTNDIAEAAKIFYKQMEEFLKGK